MIIDRDSWHMRVCRTAHGSRYEPRDLCRHFWSVMGGITKALLIVGVVGGWLASMGWLIYHMTQNPWIILIFFGAIIGTIIGGTLLGMAIIAIIRHGSTRPKPPKPKRNKAPGLLSSWIKAKKGRVCPMIEIRE